MKIHVQTVSKKNELLHISSSSKLKAKALDALVSRSVDDHAYFILSPGVDDTCITHAASI